MSNINTSFLTSLIIILLGYLGKRIGLVKVSDGEGISRIVLNITLPAAIISAFSTMQVEPSLLTLTLICIVYGFLMVFLALFVYRKEPRKEKGMLTMLAPGFNIGLFAFPLVEGIWGKEGLKYFAMFDMGNAIICFGVSYFIASIFASDDAKVNYGEILRKVSHSAPLLAYAVTLIVNLAGLSFPALILQTASIVSRANMPLSLLVLGIYLNFRFEKEHWRKMGLVLLLRYLPGIMTGVVLYLVFPFVDPLYRTTLLLGFSLPIILISIPYSVEFGYDSKFVGTVNNMSIILSFILMWVIASVTAGF